MKRKVSEKEKEILETMKGARVRYIRVQILKLNQTEFAEKINITQTALAAIENGKNKLTERNFEAICNVFNVNPEWLATGVGKEFKEKSFVDELAKKYNLGFKEKTLIESILNLPPTARDAVIDWALDFATKIEEENIRQENEFVKKRRKLQQQKKDIEAQLKKIDEEEQAAFDNAKKDSPLEDTG